MHLPVGIIEHPGSLGEIHKVDVFLDKLRYQGAHIVDLGESLEERDHLEETAIIGVIVPRKDRHGILVMKVIGVWRIVYNDNVFHIATKQ